jgi:hypothetical protein
MPPTPAARPVDGGTNVHPHVDNGQRQPRASGPRAHTRPLLLSDRLTNQQHKRYEGISSSDLGSSSMLTSLNVTTRTDLTNLAGR